MVDKDREKRREEREREVRERERGGGGLCVCMGEKKHSTFQLVIYLTIFLLTALRVGGRGAGEGGVGGAKRREFYQVQLIFNAQLSR